MKGLDLQVRETVKRRKRERKREREWGEWTNQRVYFDEEQCAEGWWGSRGWLGDFQRSYCFPSRGHGGFANIHRPWEWDHRCRLYVHITLEDFQDIPIAGAVGLWFH
jgi:hypothetical protein